MGLNARGFRYLKELVTTVLVGLLLIGILRFLPQQNPTEFIGFAKVADGDSLEMDGQRIRLIGVDAPEGQQYCTRSGQRWACGTAAARALRQKLSGRTVTCTSVELDQFERALARCEVDGEDLNAWLVRNGWAVSFGSYFAEERKAKEEKLGIWASEFQIPQDWRRDHRR